MDMQLVNRRNLIIAGSVVLLVMLIVGLFVAQNARNSTNTEITAETQNSEKVDKNSGTTIPETDNGPETVGILPDAPLFLNIEEFVTNGLTIDQLNSLKYALYQYTTTQSPKIKQVSITKDSVSTVPPNNDGKASLTFNVVFDNGPKMNGSMVYFEKSVELTLANSNGTKVFESGTITGKSIYLQQ